MIKFIRAPPWAREAVLEAKPYLRALVLSIKGREPRRKLCRVEFRKGKRRHHMAYYSPRSGVLCVYQHPGHLGWLLAHELAHVVLHEHCPEHYELTGLIYRRFVLPRHQDRGALPAPGAVKRLTRRPDASPDRGSALTATRRSRTSKGSRKIQGRRSR